MFKGFYNLTSGMLTQGRMLDVVANNMTNVSTAGYKMNHYTATTFDEVMFSRIGNKDKSAPEEIGTQSYMLVSSQLYTDYTQGLLEDTGIPLNFALEGDGFFAIQDGDGAISYTRSGDFSLDEEGYLCLPGQGRVLDISQEPIQILTDKIDVDEAGVLYTGNGGYLGQLGVFSFEDNGQLAYNQMGLLTGGGEAQQAQGVKVHWKRLERSNVNLVGQMTQMLTAQRALQSAAQMSKMYDQLMGKAANDISRL